MTDNIPDYIPILGHGAHNSPQEGACVMEMVSFITGDKWTDHPKTVHSALADIARNTNDFVSDDNRSIIANMIPRFIGTNEIKDTNRYNDLIRTKLRAHPELDFFVKMVGSAHPGSVRNAIAAHFQNEADESKRFTNEEYDKFAMTILEVALDAADEILERGNYAITKEEAFKIVVELPGQKANAR